MNKNTQGVEWLEIDTPSLVFPTQSIVSSSSDTISSSSSKTIMATEQTKPSRNINISITDRNSNLISTSSSSTTTQWMRLLCSPYRVRIRSAPSQEAETVGLLNSGDEFEIYSEVYGQGYYKLIDGRVSYYFIYVYVYVHVYVCLFIYEECAYT